MSAVGRRDQILAAYERLLHRYGPQKTTVADVAREAEVAVGSVYLEFPSKESLLSEISARRHGAVLAAMRAAAATQRPFAERIRATIDARVDALLDLEAEGPHACDLVHCASRAVKEAHQRFRDEELSIMVELVRGGARAGELEAPRADVVARAVLSAYLRFSAPFVWSSPREETRALLRSVHEVVLYGLVRREASRRR